MKSMLFFILATFVYGAAAGRPLLRQPTCTHVARCVGGGAGLGSGGMVVFKPLHNPNHPIYKPKSDQRCDDLSMGGRNPDGTNNPTCGQHNVESAAAKCAGIDPVVIEILNQKGLLAGCQFVGGKIKFTYSCVCGCFHKETEIESTLGDTPVDEIVALPELHEVSSFGFEHGSIDSKSEKVGQVTRGNNVKPLVSVTADGRTVLLTQEHPVLVNDGLVVRASELTGSEYLYTKEGDKVAIERIQKDVEYFGKVYNFAVDSGQDTVDGHVVSSNGLLTGDLYLQNNYGSDEESISERN